MTKSKSSRYMAVDALIPMVIPEDGITRSRLAKALGISYAQATKSLERMREHRILSRRIRKSHYVYRLIVSRESLANEVPTTIYPN